MKKILWISPCAPYDQVTHGGGKTHNFYIKYFQKSGCFDITLLSLCLENEKTKLDLDAYGIKNNIYVSSETGIKGKWRYFLNGLSYGNPLDPFGGICLNFERYQILRLLKNYRKKQEIPDIVILHWTFSLMIIEKIKRYFPESKVIAVEEDVTFLNYERKRDKSVSAFSKLFWTVRYRIMKNKELGKLNKVNYIVTNNTKDTKLLEDNGIPHTKIYTAAPYFDNYYELTRNIKGKSVIFWGAMDRPENYKSAIWFIKNVMPLLQHRDVQFLVVGRKPNIVLKKYESDNIKITGYISDVKEYFSHCFCMAAPLIGGAGIKIKILEAMSAGVPVLTNDIGIEGIPAVSGRDFFYCVSAKEYAECIDGILDGKIDIEAISANAKKFIAEHYNLSQKLDGLINILI